MANKIREYYANYTSTIGNFETFHNQVINMPRDSFSISNLKKIKKLCAYISLIDSERLKQSFNNCANLALKIKPSRAKIAFGTNAKRIFSLTNLFLRVLLSSPIALYFMLLRSLFLTSNRDIPYLKLYHCLLSLII